MENYILETLADGWKIKGYKPEYGLAEGAYREDYIPMDAIKADVPGTIQSALFKMGRIPDPYQGLNSEKIKWCEELEWWYFKDFKTPCRKNSEQRVWICFEGITYRAEVWVNGIQVGRIEGMFRTDRWDVTDFLNKVGKSNRLTVRVRAQENARLDDKGKLQGVVRTQGAVAQNMSYWNWSRHLVCIGIWRPVQLLMKSSIEIDLIKIKTLDVDLLDKDGLESPNADATIKIDWDICNNGDKDETVSLKYEIGGETFSGKVAAGKVSGNIPAGCKQTLSVEISLAQARLWWPNGLGKAELHRLKSCLQGADRRDIEKKEEVFGIRKYSFLHNECEDWVKATSKHSVRPWSMIGEMYKWTFIVNGRKTFLKGSNWVLLDSMLQLDRERYDRILSLAKGSNINFLRIWGGSLAETKDFYDLCDRYGIMCCQEFWLACGNYPAMNYDVFLRCVRDTVRRLVNRASLVYYSGGNEYEPDNKENKILVDKMDNVVRKIDSTREFRRGSPYKGDKHGGLVMTPLMTRNKYLDILPGDSRIVLFRSEVAVGRSTPLLSEFEKMIPEGKRWPMDETLWKHFFAVPAEFKMFAHEYDALDSLKHALFANYFTHGWLCRYNMEYCRSQMFKCSGNLNWQLNAPWPCMHRELIEYNGVAKPAFYWQLNASKPMIGVVDMERYLWHPGEQFSPNLYIVNDGKKRADVQLTIQFYTTESQLLHEVSFTTDVDQNSTLKRSGKDLFKIAPEFAGKTILVYSELSEKEVLLHSNLYWIAISNNPVPKYSVSLCGEWTREDGLLISLPGNDLYTEKGESPNEYMVKDGEKDFERADKSACPHSAVETERVSYKKRFVLPEELKNRDLEFYSPGFEASDEVWINGTKIGSHLFKHALRSGKDMAHIPFGKTAASSDIDPDTEYFYWSDPITFPKLEARFYDIPECLLNQNGENEVLLILKSNYMKIVSNTMEIRPKTQHRKEISAFFKRGQFFKGLREMPEASVQVSLTDTKRAIIVKNTGTQIAIGVTVEFIPDCDGLPMTLNDNLFPLFPGEEKKLCPLRANERMNLPAKIRLYAWNVREQQIKVSGETILKPVYLLSPNRVRRNYRGGAMLNKLAGSDNPMDGEYPEDWLASTTKAHNPGLKDVPDEGLSFISDARGEKTSLKALFEQYPEHFLGKEHWKKQGTELGFLTKLLDSSMRLHVQAHPTAEFAQKYLNSKWGKFESYVILGVRENAEGYIRLGFQRPPSPEQWKQIVLKQDIAAMDACFDKIPVKPGDVWIVPGGVPHAIGEGVFVLEIMEPTDLVVRCEFEREGIVVPPEARFMGKSPEFALRIFDYSPLSIAEAYKKYRIVPKVVHQDAHYEMEQLIGAPYTNCFNVSKLKIKENSTMKHNGKFGLGFVRSGKGIAFVDGSEISLNEAAVFMIAASARNIEIIPEEEMELLVCQPSEA
ncbi:MAG: sugar-binding domain-containing protein [Lentisphaeria bacterium]